MGGILKNECCPLPPVANKGLHDGRDGISCKSAASFFASCILLRSSFIFVTIAGSFPIAQSIDSNISKDALESLLVNTACCKDTNS